MNLKFIVYILIFQFSIGACIPKSDFSQLLLVNDLVDHYKLHEEEARLKGESITITDFIYIHFFTEEDHEHSDPSNNHEQLPFKSISCSLNFHLTSLEFPAFISSIIQKGSTFAFNDFLSSERNIRIFHPPLAVA